MANARRAYLVNLPVLLAFEIQQPLRGGADQVGIAAGVGKLVPREARAAIAGAHAGRNVSLGVEDRLPGAKSARQLALQGGDYVLSAGLGEVVGPADACLGRVPKVQVATQRLQSPTANHHVLRAESRADRARAAERALALRANVGRLAMDESVRVQVEHVDPGRHGRIVAIGRVQFRKRKSVVDQSKGDRRRRRSVAGQAT